MVWTMSNTLRELMTASSVMTPAMGRMMGTVIFQNTFHLLAPSISAASTTSRGTLCSAASQ